MNLGEKQKKITNMNNNNLNNNIKNPLEEMKLHSQEENNNSKLDSMVLNDLQIKPKTEEKPKPFVLVKEKEIKPENKPEFKQENKQEIKQENKQENKHQNVVPIQILHSYPISFASLTCFPCPWLHGDLQHSKP